MILEYELTNFKAFAGPERIPIKPITLIFGPNSSGKSSIIQSLLLLKQTIEESNDSRIALLPKGGLVDLGNYVEFIHNHKVNNSFSFKMIFKTPDDLAFVSDIGDIFIDSPNPSFTTLGEIIKTFDSIGISTSFLYNSKIKITSISKIELYIENTPIVTYLNSNIDSKESELKLEQINFNHVFWEKYWNAFDKNNNESISFFENVIRNAYPTVEELTEIFNKWSTKEQKKYSKIFIKLYKHSTKTEVLRTITENNLEERQRLLKLRGFEQAIEVYKLYFKKDKIRFRNFLPVFLNGSEIKDIYWELSGHEDANNISLLFLTIGNMIKDFLNDIIYLGPLRSSPERIYVFSGQNPFTVGKLGTNFPDMLFDDKNLLKKVNDQLTRFKLNYELKVAKYKKPASGNSDLFEIQIVDKNSDIDANIRDVGFGISQVLPVIVQSMASTNKFLLIEQPELHLHPALQSELGSLFAECIKPPFENNFIIETHSEHLILRIQKLIRKKQLTPNDVAVIYVDKDKDGSKCLELRLDDEGDFIDEWPGGFFEEGYKEIFD